ncbi:hypothetical protein J2S43_004301 [Catenuloplanes nepalensis]|uniref:Uncharacterized protein n=1 Tax=Catenuloplanes nepalensis TaxID=587533 RepID=A0ABT9MWH1_9ACTN|nr:hypothetical protein [Catenuloplanes nepalensis]
MPPARPILTEWARRSGAAIGTEATVLFEVFDRKPQ